MGIKTIAILLIIPLIFLYGCSNIINQLDLNKIATVKIIGIGLGGGLEVKIQPSDKAIANQLYRVILYEIGNKESREVQYITFKQSEIDHHVSHTLIFKLTLMEENAYRLKDKHMDDIFTVKVENN